MTQNHRCLWGPAKRGAWMACSICDDRFPCAGNDCAHMDCIVERQKMPKCHFCGHVVYGAGPSKVLGDVPEGLQELQGEEGDWVPVNGRGNVYAAHTCCRDTYNGTSRPDLVARFKAGHDLESCKHEFENKEPMDLELLKQLAQVGE